MKKIKFKPLMPYNHHLIASDKFKKWLFIFLISCFVCLALGTHQDYNILGLVSGFLISPLWVLCLVIVDMWLPKIVFNWSSLWEVFSVVITGYYTWFRFNFGIYLALVTLWVLLLIIFILNLESLITS